MTNKRDILPENISWFDLLRAESLYSGFKNGYGCFIVGFTFVATVVLYMLFLKYPCGLSPQTHYISNTQTWCIHNHVEPSGSVTPFDKRVYK